DEHLYKYPRGLAKASNVGTTTDGVVPQLGTYNRANCGRILLIALFAQRPWDRDAGPYPTRYPTPFPALPEPPLLVIITRLWPGAALSGKLPASIAAAAT